MLPRIDGSPHAWLEDKGPRIALLTAIDAATGTIAGEEWPAHEGSAGYLALLERVVTSKACPEAVYQDRSVFLALHGHERATIVELLAGEWDRRQVARALRPLELASILSARAASQRTVGALIQYLKVSDHGRTAVGEGDDTG